MNAVRVFMARLLALFCRRRAEADLEAEIDAHLELLADEHVRRGLQPEEARAAARRAFGGVEQIREAWQDQRRLRILETLAQDLRYGLRLVRRDPAFSIVAVLTLGLGIAATGVVFSFVSAVLSASAPVSDMDRLAAIWSHNRAQGEPQAVVSPQDFAEWRRRQRSFEHFAARRSGAVNLSGIDVPVRVAAAFVTADYFDVLAQQPVVGRPFRPDDERPGAPHVAIVSNRFWRERFGAGADVPGREILLNGRPAVVVGVLPPNDFEQDVLLPLVIDPASAAYGERSLFVMARLRGGVTLEQARDDMTAIGGQIERELPETHRGWGVNTRPLQEEFVGPQARVLFALLGAASAAVLLIGCANIANLLLARGIGRARELAVRAALGASRLRLMRQMMVESMVLAIAGAAVGLLGAHWGLILLRSAFATNQTVMARAVVDGRVLAFVAVASIASTLFFGLLPALHSARADVTCTLRDASRATATPRARRLAAVLVGAEVAAAVLFLAVGILFMRTLAALQSVEPGFDTSNLLTLRVVLPENRYAGDVAVASFYGRVLERLRASPGVTSTGAAVRVPAAGSRYNPNRSLIIEGRAVVPGETRFAADLTVTPGYLETLRIPLRAGRSLGGQDGGGARLAVVVSDTVVHRYWGGVREQALGARIRLGDEPSPEAWRTIVGVVGDVRNDDIDAPPLPMVYVPLAQRASREMTLVLRTRDTPLAHVEDARAAVAAIDADQPVYEVKTMAQIFEEDLRQSVVLGAVLGIFACVALLLAAIGIYGVVSHAVAQRTREIGVRIALGATAHNVRRLVVHQGFVPVAAGLAIGLAASLGASELLASLLYGVTPTDPVTYGSVVLILAAVALIACVAPARRAMHVDPVTALRTD
jgi:putative ABC transport system permease protein